MDRLKVFLALLLCTACSAKLVDHTLAGLIKSSNEFSIDLFKELAFLHQNPNLIVSPLSAYIALAMTADGSGGETQEQFRKVLNLPDQSSLTKRAFKKFINEFKVYKDVSLSVANRVYLADKLEVNPKYKSLASEKFNSSVVRFDPTKTQETLTIMNKWVEDQTHGKIKNTINEEELQNTLMLLLNAVYFKADWKILFDDQHIVHLPFFTYDGNVTVEMMHVQNHYYTGKLKERNAKFIEIPYKNPEFKMIIIKPSKDSSLEKLIKNLDSSIFDEINKIKQSVNLQLSIPRFKIESSASLDEPLQKLGLTDMYDPAKADFTNLVSMQNFTVSTVKQKAFIEVNEKGSEAAALTQVHSRSRSMTTPTKFRVDRPSAFFIMQNDAIVFTGYLEEPVY